MLFLQIIGVELSDLPNGHESSALVRKLRHMGNKISLKNFASNTQKSRRPKPCQKSGLNLLLLHIFLRFSIISTFQTEIIMKGVKRKWSWEILTVICALLLEGGLHSKKKVLRLLRLAGSNFPNFFRVWQIGQKFWAEIFYMLIFVWSATKNGETFED